jgi:DNA-binding response OmpR family regulator
MAGEPILIIDDTPVNLKLTRILLVNEGYRALTAASAEEALELLRSYHPHLILADIQLPGMDGLELTRRVKQDEKTRDIMVVALTAFANPGDEQKAIAAGCDGYITKPIDTRSLGARIRGFLDRRAATGSAPAAAPAGPGASSLPASELHALRQRFLGEGLERARQLLLDLDGRFQPAEAKRAVHQWVGTGGLLGYTAISRLAREVEAVLADPPADNSVLRESLANLVMAFSSPREARDAAVPQSIVEALAGKRMALVGLPPVEAQRLCVALERVRGVPSFFEHSQAPDGEGPLACSLAVVYVGADTAGSRWFDPASAVRGRPLVLVGSRDHVLALDPAVQSLADEFLMGSWEPDEALVRLSLALSRPPDAAPSTPPDAAPSTPADDPAARLRRSAVVIADDDPAVVALVAATLRNFGMDCQGAANGPVALDQIRASLPQAAVLDVNMPGMDGYQVLSAIRAEKLPVRVVLLTARQQETDIIRGFTLGADDYIVKPFNPLELAARLKRLLRK